jgi:hypothetical protein
MCEDQGVSGGGTKLGDHSIDTLPDLRGVGDAVAPERPARALPSDVDRRPPLVGAVVPLHQLIPQRRRTRRGPRGGTSRSRAQADSSERAPNGALVARHRGLAPPHDPARSGGCRCVRCASRPDSTPSRRAARQRSPLDASTSPPQDAAAASSAALNLGARLPAATDLGTGLGDRFKVFQGASGPFEGRVRQEAETA